MEQRFDSELGPCAIALSAENGSLEEDLMNEMKDDDLFYEMPIESRPFWRVIWDLLRSPFCHHDYLLIYSFKSIKEKKICIEDHYYCRKCKRRTKKVWTYEV